MNLLENFNTLNYIFYLLFLACYFYQTIFVIIGFVRRKKASGQVRPAKTNHRYAIFISAKNEETVIGELLDSIYEGDYPKECYDIYVCADNCTDQTAKNARLHHAHVYERFNTELVGKGYALNELYSYVRDLKGADYYEGFIVFDADNIVDEHFLTELNKTFDTEKFDAITTYRNSKNFAQSWISASQSINYLREARFSNYPRMLVGAQCMISGTGFLVSTKVMEKNGGWPYYLLTEDIQFSADSTVCGYKIGYCEDAVVYDEQVSTFKESWKQRLRYAKGFFQIDRYYTAPLFKSIFDGKHNRLGCYDVLMTVMPVSLISLALLASMLAILAASSTMPYYVSMVYRIESAKLLGMTLFNTYFGLLLVGALTVFSEWDKIQCSTWEKIKYIPFYPIFTLSYIPINVEALFKKVKWDHIEHHSTRELS